MRSSLSVEHVVELARLPLHARDGSSPCVFCGFLLSCALLKKEAKKAKRAQNARIVRFFVGFRFFGFFTIFSVKKANARRVDVRGARRRDDPRGRDVQCDQNAQVGEIGAPRARRGLGGEQDGGACRV